MKKAFVFLVIVALMVVFATSAFAARPDHVPTPEPSISVAPTAASFGLHTACPNLDSEGIAFHVFLYRLGPGPHGE